MYERAQFGLPRLTSFVKKLLIGLFAAYVGQLILVGWLDFNVVALLAMQPGSPMLWQLVTFVLVDGGHPIMFLLGLLFLWWALAPFEASYGARRTMQLCLVSMLAASV